ncbi:MAG: hypothetical protein KIS79_04900 [Burkholderiales bacterium]|nr:hypothetical protein [Burkholderiales bacterium]
METDDVPSGSSPAAMLEQVVLVNEDIKQVVRNAFRINLMALNAILMARRAGSAAGFGIVAREMRELSEALVHSMRTLRALSDELLYAVTYVMRHARIEHVLARAATQSTRAQGNLREVLRATAARRIDLERHVAGQCAALATDLRSAVGISRVADSLAHMAKIEASWASDHRAGLDTVSEELASSLRGILPLLQALSTKLEAIHR